MLFAIDAWLPLVVLLAPVMMLFMVMDLVLAWME